MQKYIGCHLFVKSGNILTKRIYSVAFRGVRGREPTSRGVGDGNPHLGGQRTSPPTAGNPFGRRPLRRVGFVIVPTDRIFVNVFQMFFVILAIAYDMIVKMTLPNIFAVLFITKSFEC